MYITLRNGESIIIESSRHKASLNSDSFGKLSQSFNDKDTQIEDIIFKEKLNKLVESNVKSGWEKDRLKPMEKFIKNIVERGSKALQVDKNKLFSLMSEQCNYSAINYFQEGRFYDFKTSDELKKEISKLNKELGDIKDKHKKEIVKLQLQITSAKKFYVEKVESKGSGYSDYGINVNCAYCDNYQEVTELGDWNPGDGEFEGNQECDSCGKIFSVKFDGSF